MNVLVLGASSQVGHFLLPMLQCEGATVLALSRRPALAGAQDARWMQGGLPDAVPALPELDRIYSAGPLDALAAWLPYAPLAPGARVLATSSMSAASKQHSPVATERALAARLVAAEQALAAVCGVRGIGWTVLRPTLIYGAALDRSLTPLAQRARRTRLFALPAGRGLRQPVHAEDVALALQAASQRDVSPDAVLEFGGGERLTAAAMFARVRASLPFTSLGLPVPRLVLHLAALHPALRGPIARLDADLVADNTRAEALLGVRARAFLPDADCWGL